MCRRPLRRTKLRIELPRGEKKRMILSIRNIVRKDHPPMFSHYTPEIKPYQASAAHTLIIAQTTDLLLQACGLGSVQGSDQSSQTQQGEGTPRKRGRPQQIG